MKGMGIFSLALAKRFQAVPSFSQVSGPRPSMRLLLLYQSFQKGEKKTSRSGLVPSEFKVEAH